MSDEKDNDLKIAVRCSHCKKILGFKIGATSGLLQLKCPVCKAEIRIDLSLRRGRIYNRQTKQPITIPYL